MVPPASGTWQQAGDEKRCMLQLLQGMYQVLQALTTTHHVHASMKRPDTKQQFEEW
jgi:hypothetical protein